MRYNCCDKSGAVINLLTEFGMMATQSRAVRSDGKASKIKVGRQSCQRRHLEVIHHFGEARKKGGGRGGEVGQT